MGRGSLASVGIFLGVLLVLTGGAVLGVLQVRWARVASSGEELRMRVSLDRGAAQAAGHAEEEVRVLHSLAHLAPADLAARRWSRLERQLRFWSANARFPELLRGLYVVGRLPDAEVLALDQAQGRLLPAALPADLRDRLRALTEDGGLSRRDFSLPLPQMRRVIALPVNRPSDPPTARPSAVVLVALDIRILYEKVLAHYVASDMGDYLYRVVASGTGEVLARSEGLAAGRAPEVSVVISGDSLMGLTAQADLQADDADEPVLLQDEGSIALDPLLQSWLQRAQGAIARVNALPREQSPGSGGDVTLQIFYPKGSLDRAVRNRQSLNVGLSLGILALLILSVFVITSFYQRSLRLRSSEQEFVASISHELRTPIAVIQATSENLSRGLVSDPSRQQRYAEVIHAQIKRLSGMVENILLYAGLQPSRARPPSLSRIDLPALVQDVVLPLQYLAAERSSTLALELQDMPPFCCSDQMALHGIIENLVMNAIRHAESGDITLRVSRAPGPLLQIVVEDQGPGIPAREQRRVFEPFVRGERSSRAQKPGSGLGLHLLKRMTAVLGGKITLESPYTDAHHEAQKGCRFTVMIPYQERCDGA
jgi:signal transduction histidine kinase